MSDEILQGIAEDIQEVDAALATADDLISAMKEAGEDVGPQETEVRALRMRKTKWQKMLKSRGFTPTS